MHLLYCMFQKAVQGLQDMAICVLLRRAIDLRSNQMSRGFPSVVPFLGSESVLSVVGHLINWKNLYCCLEIVENGLFPLVPEPLALDSIDVIWSRAQELP